jgi:hypothetical protein
VIEGASNTFRARLSLPNAKEPLPAGLRCRAELGGVDGPAPTPRPAGAQGGDLNLHLSPNLRVPPRL